MVHRFRTTSFPERITVAMMLWTLLGHLDLSLGQNSESNVTTSLMALANTTTTKQSSASTETIDPVCSSEICPNKSGNYEFPMANNCSGYYWCTGNSSPTPRSCVLKQLFDKNTLQCVDSSNYSICLYCPSTGTVSTYSSVPSDSTVVSYTSVWSSSTTTSIGFFSSSSATTSVISEKTVSPDPGINASSSVATLFENATSPSLIEVPSNFTTTTEKTSALSDVGRSEILSATSTVTSSSTSVTTIKSQSRQISFSRKPADVVVEGTNVEFRCTFIWRTDVGGTARLDRFLWVLNGKELTATGRVTIDQPASPSSDGYYDSILRFSPVVTEDSGNVTCCALTSGFLNATSTSYQVLAKPRVIIAPEFNTASPRDIVMLSCMATVTSNVSASLISVKRIIWQYDHHNIDRGFNNSGYPVVSLYNSMFSQSTNVTCIVEFSLVNITSGLAFIHIMGDDSEAGCPPESSDGVQWSFTKVGDSNFRPCPGNKTGIAVRTCFAADNWKAPDLSECISKKFVDLQQQVDMVQNRNTVLDNQTMTNLSEIIHNTLTDPDNMTEAEFQLSIEIIADMANIHADSPSNPLVDKQELLTMMKTVDVLLSVSDLSKFTENLAVMLLSAVDTYTSLYAKQSKSDAVFFMSQNLVFETNGLPIQNSFDGNKIDLQIPSWNKIDLNTTDASYWTKAFDNSIMFNYKADDKSLDSSEPPFNYTSSCIRNLGSLMPLTENQTKTDSYINSYLVSLTVIGLDSDSTPSVNISLEHLRINKSMTGKCVYWNFSASDNGSWRDDGCITVSSNESHTTCSCNHLTNFAILMSPYPARGINDIVLSTISMVGCIISVIALVLTILLYGSQWKKMKSKRAAVLINLCFALIFANVVFLAGSSQTKSEIGCKVVAAFLHYFFLSAFFLMLLEGILLLMYVVFVFYVHRTSHTIALLFSAWFIPAIIVAISLGVTRTNGYGTETTCWLSVEQNVIWAFVAPALFIILVNLVIVIIVLVRISNAKVRSDLKKDQNKILSVLRNVVILSPILGITWVFGVLSVNQETVAFQYIFTIFNSLQGLFIFVLHGLCHAKNKKSSISSRPKRWTGAPSKIAQRAHGALSEGGSQEDLVRPNRAEQELYLEQNILRENSVYEIPFDHQLSNMSHVSNGTAQTYVSSSLSTNGMSSQ